MNYRRENFKFWSFAVFLSVLMTVMSCFSHYVKNCDTERFRIFSSYIFYNNSPSTPRGLYIKIPMLWLSRGDYVVYQPYEEVSAIAVERGWNKSRNTSFLKRVRGIAGDAYSSDLIDGFYVNGRYFGSITILDSKGQFMPMHLGSYHVPPDEFLPVGENSMSFDGRYTGTVSKRNIQAKVIPLLTEAMIP